jgi:hypothetical protein
MNNTNNFDFRKAGVQILGWWALFMTNLDETLITPNDGDLMSAVKLWGMSKLAVVASDLVVDTLEAGGIGIAGTTKRTTNGAGVPAVDANVAEL